MLVPKRRIGRYIVYLQRTFCIHLAFRPMSLEGKTCLWIRKVEDKKRLGMTSDGEAAGEDQEDRMEGISKPVKRLTAYQLNF